MFTRITEFLPAYDKRDRNPSKNYGIHGVDLRMILKGPLGAIQFILYTNWHLPHVHNELSLKASNHFLLDPLPADFGCHSPTPQYEGQTRMADPCEYLDGRPCYYDGSSLQAQDIFGLLLTGGSDAVWSRLEEEYHHRFTPSSSPPHHPPRD